MCKIYVSEIGWHEGDEKPIKDNLVFGTKKFSSNYFILYILPGIFKDIMHLSFDRHSSSLRKYRITLTFKF